MDPNKRAKQEFEMATARRKFVQAFNDGSAGALDRFGRPLKDGDTILFSATNPILFTVRGLGPDLRPNLPPGAIKFELVATMPYQVLANQPLANVIKIAELSEPGAGERAPVKLPPEPEDPGPEPGNEPPPPERPESTPPDDYPGEPPPPGDES